MRNNQIREIGGLLQCYFAATEKEDTPSSHGWEGTGPMAWSVPERLGNLMAVTSVVTWGWSCQLPWKAQWLATATRHFAGRECCHWHHSAVTSAAEQGHTGAHRNSICSHPELIVDFLYIQLSSKELFYSFTLYGFIAHVQASRLIACGRPESPHNIFPLLD